MATYTIGQVADRSGFTASALRYYEGIGLVAPASRTGAGYRLYDEHVLTRLAFIDRAKRLGCSLEEVSDLVGIWDGERCGPLQRRFHDLVTDKMAAARRQIAELEALTGQLAGAAAQLAVPAVDGPCDETCACVSEVPPAGPQPVPVALVAEPLAPVACTLDPGSLPERLAEWRAVLDHAASRLRTADGGLRIEFDGDLALDGLTRLAAAEQRCCAFLGFAITVDHRGVALEVQAPESAGALVTALFGAAAPGPGTVPVAAPSIRSGKSA